MRLREEGCERRVWGEERGSDGRRMGAYASRFSLHRTRNDDALCLEDVAS